jgi:small subunit ribosomal protein S6
VVRPSVGDDGLENTISSIESAIKNYGGNVVKVDEPLKRRFTHKIKGFKDGYYVSLLFNSPPELPNTLKRTLSINDDVLRYILVKQEK